MTIDVTKPDDKTYVSELPIHIREAKAAAALVENPATSSSDGYMTKEQAEVIENIGDLTLIDNEITAARGSKSSLVERLNVATYSDGTLKADIEFTPSQWVSPSYSFTYNAADKFIVSGDQTDIYVATRRLKINFSVNPSVYSEVSSSSFGAGNTTVTIKDSVLDMTLTTVDHSVLLPTSGNSALSMSMLEAASDTAKGIIELATNAEVQTGTDAGRAVTPAGLTARTATETRTGVVELATDTETQTGTDTARAITPANLTARTATESRTGVAALASASEVLVGTEASKVVTPATLVQRTGTETRTGILELATDAETLTGTDTERAVTPANTAALLASPPALGSTAPNTIYGKVGVTSHSTSETATALSMYGNVHRVLGAYTITLPSAVVGMSALFEATTAVAFSVKAGPSNKIILNGVELDNGDKITSLGGISDTVYLVCDESNKWRANLMNAVFTDGGA